MRLLGRVGQMVLSPSLDAEATPDHVAPQLLFPQPGPNLLLYPEANSLVSQSSCAAKDIFPVLGEVTYSLTHCTFFLSFLPKHLGPHFLGLILRLLKHKHYNFFFFYKFIPFLNLLNISPLVECVAD